MKKGDYKWVLLALVSAAYFLAQGTRNVYGAVLPAIGADLNLSPAARGAVATAPPAGCSPSPPPPAASAWEEKDRQIASVSWSLVVLWNRLVGRVGWL